MGAGGGERRCSRAANHVGGREVLVGRKRGGGSRAGV